jgi:hypothetical protein
MKNVFGTVRQVEPMVDQEGCSIPVLLQEHMAVHNGNFFSLTGKMNIATGQTAAIALVLPANLELHLREIWVVASAGPINASLLEDYTMTGGTVYVPMNHRRKAGAPASLLTSAKYLANATPAAGASPFILDTLLMPQAQLTGSDLITGEEWLFYGAKNLLITFANTNAGAADVNYSIGWYEWLES